MSNFSLSNYLPNLGGFDPMANWGRNAPSNALSGGFDMGIPGQNAPEFSVPDLGHWGGIPAVSQDRGLMSSFLQQKYADGTTGGGYGTVGLNVLQGLGNAYMGMKQYGLAKNSLEESKKQFNLNYDAQRKTTNAALEDRQAARVASNPGGYQSVGDYMKKNGI